jgi:hypothetical protein
MKLAEWQVRHVCMWIGAQAAIGTDQSGRNPLVDAAMELSIFGDRERSQEEKELDMIRGEKVADRVEDDPRLTPVAADPAKGVEAANPKGSYEAFMVSFGARMNPAEEGQS